MASTSLRPCTSKGVDGRDKPGHDGDENEGTFSSPSPVRRVERDVLGDLALPTVAVREQALLVVVELLARFGGEFEIGSLDNRIDGAGFLAQPAIDAFHHIDVVTGCSPRAVVAARAGLDGDCLRRTDRLAQLAGNAALLSVRIATQCVLTAEAR